MSEYIALSEAGSEGGDIVPACYSHLVQGLAMSSLDMLDHHITVDEVGPNPGRVEACPAVIQEHHAHYVIPYMPFLVDLIKEGKTLMINTC